MTRPPDQVDCLIVGGGPAGLTAAIYAARFRLSTTVVDAGESRAALIPCTRNHSGFPEGISGTDLLDRMRMQAAQFGAAMVHDRVLAITGQIGNFAIQIADGMISARSVILATGVSNHRPDIEEAVHTEALRRGLLRYCPVCDGFEVTDKRVGVIGSGKRAVKEVAFLRSYTDQITLISPGGAVDFDDRQIDALTALGVVIAPGLATAFCLETDGLSLDANGKRLTFDSIYPALGSTIHSDLAAGLGADLTKDGCVKVDAHQRTSVPGFYAAGDVVIGLDQISHAMGEAGVAATTLRNDLAAIELQRR